MAVIDEIIVVENGISKSVDNADNKTIDLIRYENKDYHFAKPNEVSGKNLLDVSKAETGSLVGADGSDFASTNRARTPFVYVKKGTYTISMRSDIRATTMFFYSQPIASGYFIGKYATTPTILNGRRVATFPVEQDCYLRCVFVPEDESKTTDLSANTLSNYNVMIEQGTTATEYEIFSGIGNQSRICENAVNEPIIDMQIKGNSKQVLLPKEYQQVEFLTNSGTQRIDTGIIPTNNTSIDITYQSLTPTGTSQYIAGSRANANATLEYIINGSSSSTYWDVRLGAVTTTLTNISRMSEKIRSYLQLNNGAGTWTLTRVTAGTTYTKTISGAKVNATSNLFLFAYNNLDTNTHVNLRIFACKIYEAGVLVRNYVPCYRKLDGVAGMYDLVEDKFYINAGTGSFSVAGDYVSEPTPDTPSEIISVGEKTKNLFNKNDIDTTRHLTDGLADFNIANVKNYNCTGFIEVEPNTKYIKHGTLGSRAQAYFDENKNFIGTTVLVNGGATFTTPSNCKYIVLNLYVPNAPYDDVQLEKGTTATKYEPYGYKIPINICGENLANENTIQENKLIGNSANGIINDSTTYNTLYMEVEQGRTYVFKNFVRANGTTLRGCFYDSNGAWVSAFEETTVTIPSGVKYVGRSFSKEAQNVELYKIYSTKEIYLKEPLRKIGDCVDMLDYKNKKVIRNIKSIQLNSSYDWRKYTGSDAIPNVYFANLGESIRQTNHSICSHFTYKSSVWAYGKVGEFCDHPSNSNKYFVTNKETVDEWKTWLDENNVILNFTKSTPTEETIEVPEIMTLDETTTLDIETLEPSALIAKYWKQI